MRLTVAALALAAALLPTGCGRSRPATAAECAGLLDAIVTLELEEQGYRDPALLERRQRTLRRTLGPELTACAGLPLAPGALDCARRAGTIEQLTHRCLR
jgi:hypothetical protein